jgi:hypothetical protein
MSQTKVGILIGRDQTFVSKYENGERSLDTIECREICMAVCSSFERFIRRLTIRIVEEGCEFTHVSPVIAAEEARKKLGSNRKPLRRK